MPPSYLILLILASGTTGNNTRTATASVVWWSQFLATDAEVRVPFPALPDFLRSNGSGTGSTLPRQYKEELLERKSSDSGLENRD
jgi:hypothetical protein